MVLNHIHTTKGFGFLKALLLLLLFSGCSSLSYLEEDQKLYKGSKIRVESEKKIENKSEVVAEVERVIRPKPNERFLGIRPRLWVYNIAGEDPEGGIRGWMKTRIGRPPVLWQDFDAERSVRLVENRLFNMGFFDANVDFIARESQRTARAEFLVSLEPAFTIKEILPLGDDKDISSVINASLEETLIRPGEGYRLSKLKQERERINQHLKELGYFYFHHDFLIFRADTTVGNREVSLSLELKPNTPSKALKKYKIRNVYINAGHTPELESDNNQEDTLNLADNFFLVNNHGLFRPSTLKGAVFFENGQWYNSNNHDLTLNHLMGLEVFKFVNVRFRDVAANDNLDVHVQLTPMEKKTISTELRGVSKSTNFAGPGLTVSFHNRNFLGGAEHFSLNLDGSYEVLLGGREAQSSSYEAGLSSELAIPQFLAPFGISNISPRFVPRTLVTLSFNFLSRTDAFSVSSARSQFGYQWNQSVTTRHRYMPFVFNIFSLGTISEDYEQIFSDEVLFRRGLFEQFLLGSEYSFQYNSQLKERRKHDWYLNFNLDFSGNLLYLFMEGFGLGESDIEGDYGIFNQSFSQYSKADFDVRYYLDMRHGQRLVSRIAAGVGIPYGNSSTLPYIKLFSIGGSNSIRAFHPRTLGPGSYETPDTLATSFNIYQSGEMKLELNLEYRYEFTSIVKGALFADAGNVWNLRERERAPGGKFESNEFLSQIALGTGFGLRFDFTFFILRLDLAFPLAIPYDDSLGYFQAFKPFDGAWRRDNLLFNLAIGYPF